MTQLVKEDSKVLVHMTVEQSDGAVADSTRASGEPLLIQLGDESISRAFEQELIGLEQGSQARFELSAEDAFGEANPDNIQFFERYQFPEEDLEIDTIMLFEGMDGSQVPGVIKALEGASVKVDFNHPLAGQAVTFDIEIVDIDPVADQSQPINIKTVD